MLEIKLNPRNYKIYQALMYLALSFITIHWCFSLVPVYRRPYDEVSDRIVTEKLDNFKQRINFNEPIAIRLYWMSANDSFNNFGAFRDKEGGAIIFVNSRFNSKSMSDDSLSVVLAHELGHLSLNHCLPNFKHILTISEDEMEIEADAIVLRMVGRDNFLNGFLKLRGYHDSLNKSPRQRLKDAELYNQTHDILNISN